MIKFKNYPLDFNLKFQVPSISLINLKQTQFLALSSSCHFTSSAISSSSHISQFFFCIDASELSQVASRVFFSLRNLNNTNIFSSLIHHHFFFFLLPFFWIKSEYTTLVSADVRMLITTIVRRIWREKTTQKEERWMWMHLNVHFRCSFLLLKIIFRYTTSFYLFRTGRNIL